MCIYLGGYDFDGPCHLDHWTPPHDGGIYVVLRRDGTTEDEATYMPIYFGQSDDLAAHDVRAEHPRSACWTKEAGSHENLWIGVHYMPGATRFARQVVEEMLLGQYRPVCNYERVWTERERPMIREDGHNHHLSLG